jgi:hypothetical protein
MAKTKNPPAGGAPADDDEDDGDISPKQRELIISTVNAAVSTHLGRKLTGAIAEAIGPALEPITAQLAELGKAKGGQQQGAPGGAGAGAGAGGATDPAVAAMQSELTKLQTQLKARDDEAAKAKIATAAAQRDGKLTELLTAGGVDKLRLRGAAAVVRDSLVQDPKDGSWKYRAQRDGYHEDLEVGAGIKEFLDTDEGKAYLPATAGANGGSGARPRGGQGAGARQVSTKDPKAAKAERQGKALDTLMSMVQQSTDGDGVVQLGDD